MTRERILVPTSPSMTDDDTGGLVTATQKLLHSNRFGEFFQGDPTGSYGEGTQIAVHTAKYWLGYGWGKVNRVAGDQLRQYLRGEPLGPVMRARRAIRIRQAARSSVQVMRDRAVTLALSQVGYHEGANNSTKFGEWYGINHAPWCAMFVTYCFVSAGASHAFARGSRYSYVPNIVSDAKARRNGLSIVTTPARGDLVCYFWHGVGDPGDSHVEMFLSGSSTSFEVIGGNVGDRVVQQRRSRSAAQTVYFVRVSK